MAEYLRLTYLLYFSGDTATCGAWPDRESGSNVTCHLLHFANLLFPAPEDLIRRHLSIAFLSDPLLFALLDHFGITLMGLCLYFCFCFLYIQKIIKNVPICLTAKNNVK